MFHSKIKQFHYKQWENGKWVLGKNLKNAQVFKD